MKNNDNQEQPKFILKFNDGVMKPKVESKAKSLVKCLLGIATIFILIIIILFGNDFWEKITLPIIVCYIIAIVYLTKNGGYVRAKTPCEIWFYNDYLVQYYPKKYYSKNNIRKEYYKFYYKDIKRCLYRSVVNKIDIYGVVEATFYKYDKQGNVSDIPQHHVIADSISVFYTIFEPSIDFIKVIEKYTAVKVEIEES